MKLAVLTNDYSPNPRGGGGIIAEQYVRSLQARGHEVRVLKCSDVRRRNILARVIFHLRDLFARDEIVREILEIKPDMLLTHNLTGCGFGTPKAIQRAGIPWVHMLHDVQLVEPSGQIIQGESHETLRRLWRYSWSRLRRVALGKPTAVFSPTKWLLDFHKSYGFFREIKSTVIPNPIPTTDHASKEGGTSPPLQGQGLLFVGRLSKDKGLDLLLAAWNEFGSDRPLLHIVGDGELEKDIESISDPLLVKHGHLSHDEVLSLMRKCETVTVPSRVWENQPTVILEALSQGCRVIASDVGGIPETLGNAGRLFPAGNIQALRDALRQTIGRVRTTEEIAAAQIVIARHRVDDAADVLEAFLRSNLNTRNFHPSSV
ncbi:MAG: glycosyltransferase [Patescibacteria group bacterium]